MVATFANAEFGNKWFTLLEGARWGFKATLIAGLGFQTCALTMLMGWQVSLFKAMVY